MLTEIKLFVLTKHLLALFGDKEAVIRLLDDLLHHEDMHPNYWELWMERFEELNSSKAVQIVLLRSAGYSYRKIQDTIRVAPSTIQKVIENYSLDYGELEGTKLLKFGLEDIENRLGKAGSKLW